jgi:hypothetical protein
MELTPGVDACMCATCILLRVLTTHTPVLTTAACTCTLLKVVAPSFVNATHTLSAGAGGHLLLCGCHGLPAGREAL